MVSLYSVRMCLATHRSSVQETLREYFMMISPNQLAQTSATLYEAKLKGMNCNKMSTLPSVVIYVGLIEAQLLFSNPGKLELQFSLWCTMAP